MRIEFEVPEAVLDGLLGDVIIPRMARVQHDIPTPAPLRCVYDAVQAELARPELQDRIFPGQSVAIGVGSRGIGRLPEIVRSLVTWVRERGADPFIFPSMGSHGGATAEGQQAVLSHLGVTEDTIGARIRSSMDAVVLGETSEGNPVYLDRLACDADAILFVARVKPHTAFRGAYESGLAKMIAIGLGKQAGAAMTHARGFGEMGRMVPEMAVVALQRAPIRFGIAMLENAHDEPYKVVAVPAERIMEEEPALLDEAKAAMPRLPFDAFDVLIVDQIGKNISGDGADPNVTGRYPTPYAEGGPHVNKQVVLDLSDHSAGNANGIGTADYTTVRAARKMDLFQTYPNALTSTVARPVAIPMVLPSDRLAIAAALLTCNAVARAPTVVRIVDTLHLDKFWVSESLVAEVKANHRMRIDIDPGPVAFNKDGNLF